MKVRIASNPDQHIHAERQMIWSHPWVDVGILADANLPPTVERAYKLISESLRLDHPPLIMFPKSVHGSDIGAIIIERRDEELFEKEAHKTGQSTSRRPFPYRSLSARISFGPSHSGKNEDYATRKNRLEQEGWDPVQMDRYHISVTGIVTSFPQGFTEKAIQETLHYSLRWIDGKYQDWNVLVDKHKNNPKVYSDPMRSSYTQLETFDTGDEGNDIMALALKKLGNSKREINVNAQTIGGYAKEVGNDGQYCHAMSEFGWKGKFMPQIGFDHVHERLATVGLDANNSVPKNLSPEVGTDVVFAKVLPAMMKYVGFK